MSCRERPNARPNAMVRTNEVASRQALYLMCEGKRMSWVLQSLPPGVRLFELVRSSRYAGSIGHMATYHREMRIYLHALSHFPWDDALHEEGLKVIRSWESRHGVRYIRGSGIALYDAAHKIRQGMRFLCRIVLLT